MNDHSAAIGKLILRLYLGLALLGHGIPKLLGGIDGVTGMVVGHGLPAWVAYGAYLGEVVGPLLVIIGFYTRIGAGLIVVSMLFAFGLAHVNDLFTLSDHGSWTLELQGFFLFTALAVGLLGSGRYAVRPD